ncbi:TPA: restriction endonuclease [Pseudomonas aeruginosa]|nr:restriction endonuclease [Pseudomonas aeruginosa]HCF1625960.1 restriction endonuclease [Pseudomonas aeruginosa]HCI2709848.1 restriction endonuclease [Pseudomonas aeruginosa]HCI4040380.1 restriction endonuclease [Pseudomonas aeruginosa]HEH8725813.1 restriction endonuclease [Pseudomonas aeruginosa]
MSDKKKIFKALYRQQLGTGNVDFLDLLKSLACSALKKSPIDAEKFAEANKTKYWNWLSKEIDDLHGRGILPYHKPLAGTYSLQCASNTNMQSSDLKERRQGFLTNCRAEILKAIDSLSDREFEGLACVACDTIGSNNRLLTPSGNEGGIDFFATLSINTRTHVFSAAGSEVRIVGQCKKYESLVSVDRLEQFITTLTNVRHRSPRVKPHIPHWFEQSRGPIIGWVISYSGFQTGAADEAKQHGIVLSDGLDIAELISLSENFLPQGTSSERASRLVSEAKRLIT